MNLKEEFTLSIGNSISGAPLSVKGYKFSNGTGPSIYIQGGTHGGEVTFPIFSMISEFLENSKDWSGTVTLVPIANPISWNQRSYFYTAGKFNNYDGKDWNRSFPGNPQDSTANRIANIIFEEAKKHDVVIDLHTSRTSKPFFIISNEELLGYTKNSGIEYTYLAPKIGVNCPLPDAIDAINGKGFTIECGSHDSMNKDDFEKSFKAILNIMRKINLLNDTKNIENKSFVFTEYENYFSPVSGFVEYNKKLGEEIKSGDTICTVYDSSSLCTKVEVKAINDCVIMKYQPSHIATIGDELALTVKLDNIKELH